MKKRKIAMALLISCLLAGCSGEDVSSKDVEKKAESVGEEIVDQASNLVQAEEEHVVMVKEGYPTAYPQCKYGAVFNEFFGAPTWKYFHADTGEDVVEFTGYCMYMDAEVKSRLQFILDLENNTFEAGAMSFNDVPQTNLVTWAMIEKAFEEYMENHGIAASGEGDLEEEIQEMFYQEEAQEQPQDEAQRAGGQSTGIPGPDEPYYSDEGETMDVPHVMIENSSSAYISDGDIYWMTPNQLRYAKNEIYARHGRRFQSSELQNWFDGQEWYNGYIAPEDFDEGLLSEIEKANIQVIQHRMEVNSR